MRRLIAHRKGPDPDGDIDVILQRHHPQLTGKATRQLTEAPGGCAIGSNKPPQSGGWLR
jgi:hypothetical protein